MGRYRTTGNLSLHTLRNLAFRFPPLGSIFLPSSTIFHSKGGNFGIFSSFSSISQRLLLSQQTQQNVDVNTRRFYCVHPPLPPPPPPTEDIPNDIKGFLEWYRYKSFETVPYTNRTRRILCPRDFEIWDKKISFKEWWLMENEGMLLLFPTHPDVVRVKMIFNNIIYALQRDLKKMRNTKRFEENGKWERVPPASTSHLDGVDWEVFVVNNPDDPYFSEASCYTYGKIVLSHYLVSQEFGSDIEIATIISHEVCKHMNHDYPKFGLKSVGERKLREILRSEKSKTPPYFKKWFKKVKEMLAFSDSLPYPACNPTN